MRGRGRIVAVLAAADAVVVSIIAVQVVVDGSHNLKLASALIVLTLATVGVTTWYLAGRSYPAEKAFELGYQAGFRDGRRSETLNVVPLRKVG